MPSTSKDPLVNNSPHNYQAIDSSLHRRRESIVFDDPDEFGVMIEEETPLSQVENLWLIEFALFSNVFLSGFDGTVTASTYQTIGNEFNHVDISSWITTSYLIASTSFQPLYGSFSDVMGRRRCLFFANTMFAIGCLACAVSPNIYFLNTMRALTGVGGGGLVTLSTIVNSDMIPPSKRGIFQAFQNLFVGIGAVIGASVGGVISTYIGWRWCFLLQVPFSLMSTVVSHMYVKDQKEYTTRMLEEVSDSKTFRTFFRDIDISGSILIVLGLTAQLFYLSLGSSVSSGLTWTSPSLLALLGVSILFLYLFGWVEVTTKAKPIIPKEMIRGCFSFIILTISLLVGFASYAYLFTLPLFFQMVLGDSTAKAGLRLTIPSFFTPVGSIITGVAMTKYNCLQLLLHVGIFLMFIGNGLFLLIGENAADWLVALYLIPANAGQGITFPSTLFTFIFAFFKEDQASATSTLYLFRSIGSVWGVAGSACLIRLFVSNHLESSLRGIIDDEKLKDLILNISLNTSYVNSLHGEVKRIVVESFDLATKRTHLISTLLCLLAFLLCIFRDIFKPKTFKQKQEMLNS